MTFFIKEIKRGMRGMTELTDNLLQLFCVFICGCCSCISAIRNRSYNRLLVLLFYLSFGMGLAYWVLYLILLGTSPLVFCVSELSWTASYIFLTLRLYADVPKEKHKRKRYFGFYRCFLWVWVFSFACEAVILRTS